MTFQRLLQIHARVLASDRAARWARRTVLLGGTGIAVALLLARAGYDVPLVRIPFVPVPDGSADRVFWFVAVSFAGLLQGLALLALLFLAALLLRYGGAWLQRVRAHRVAATLDRTLGTDRFCAALEARGRLAPLVAEEAVAHAPSPDLLRRATSRRADRWLRRLVVALVLVVALAPGTAPGAEGEAPVAGVPEGGRKELPLRLELVGTKDSVGPDDPVPVTVLAAAAAPPAEDLDLPVRIVIDDGEESPTRMRLFLAGGAPGQDAVDFDLRPWTLGLQPGEHRAVARAGDAESNPYVFRIEPPGEAGGGQQPPPPGQPPPPKEPPPAQGGEDRTRPRFVEPLVRDENKVLKRAKVPIEVAGGGAPSEVPLDQAWPELQRRQEADLNRPGLSPAARKLVKDYFDRLRPEGR